MSKYSICIALDSDGTVFNNMLLKHRACFCPEFIRFYNFIDVRATAHEVWEFVNLFSRTRGINRYKALSLSLKYMQQRIESNTSDSLNTGELDSLNRWIHMGSELSLNRLEKDMRKDSKLRRVYNWSLSVNQSLATAADESAPFDSVPSILEDIAQVADIRVVSQAPTNILENEWEKFNLKPFVKNIYGQEWGSKINQLSMLQEQFGQSIIMIGDAPSDFNAARMQGVQFYPIIPGKEDESWREFSNFGFNLLTSNSTRNSEYKSKIQNEFLNTLPIDPPWILRNEREGDTE